MSAKQTGDKITALYERLSRDDEATAILTGLVGNG